MTKSKLKKIKQISTDYRDGRITRNAAHYRFNKIGLTVKQAIQMLKKADAYNKLREEAE